MTLPSPLPDPKSEWTVETLRQFVLAQFAGMDRLIGELKEANSRLLGEMDLRYQQRYDAQIKALDAALLAAEKAVQTALLAAKEAVNKAEGAAERRFEAVNEFRAQLSDQASTFMPRVEAEARTAAQAEKISEMGQRMAELTARIDRREGQGAGHDASTRNLATIAGLVIAVIAVAVTIVLSTR
jgi:Fe2+ transport system protein B